VSDARHQGDGTTQARTRTDVCGALAGTLVPRVPGLTVLFHSDPERIGERAVLDALGTSRGAPLSRNAPDFAAPGGELCRPLDDMRLSRTPIVLRRRGDAIHFERGTSRIRLELEGRPVEDGTSVPAAALDDGVVLLLGGRVVLLLHLLDPVTDLATPRFGLVGESPAMARLRREVVQVADLEAPVLLRGESGTGKELVARAIHDASPRRRGSWLALNMAALPPALAAAELFGTERGAYTGAERRRRGHFARARGGTLFLDEIGATPLEVQPLLLRALENGEIQAVGGTEVERTDARVISATDADLEAAIADGSFRAPLFHRLGGYVIRLPPLRARREDFGRLLLFLLRRELQPLRLLHRLAPRDRPWLPAALVARLAAWSWPGNVRQLANVTRQLVIANRDADPATRFEEVEALLARESPRAASGPAAVSPSPPSQPPGSRLASDVREEEVIAALRAHRFRPAEAAKALGIPRSSIYDRIARIPSLRQAGDLSSEEIAAARERVGPSVEAMAAELEVSERALLRRMGELGL
jgi:two-component system, NtrC family, nitrogen regulation response regulator GlnG